jgi:hypothetical protein
MHPGAHQGIRFARCQASKRAPAPSVRQKVLKAVQGLRCAGKR